jgi:hypothetical protein
MLLSINRMRVGVRHLAGGALLLLLAGCGSADLLLPGHGVPAELRAVSGDGQIGFAGTPVRNPLVVEALDASGLPVAGARVVFQFLNQVRGAEIAPSTPATGENGRAAVEVTLGAVVGDQPVEARLADFDNELSVQFLLTAIQPAGGGGGGGGDDEDDDPPPDDDDDDNEGNGGGGGDEGGDDGGGGGGSGPPRGGNDDDEDREGNGGGEDDDGDGDGGDDDNEGRGGDDDNEGKGGDDNKGKGGGDKGDGGKDDDNSGKGNADDRDDEDRDDEDD